MPELPEVETIARDVDAAIAGATITDVIVAKGDVLREITDAAILKNRVSGTTIVRSWRRAKHIVISLSSGDHLVVQPRFTGAILIGSRSTLPERETAYITVEFVLDDGRSFFYSDVRRLGTVSLMTTERFEAYMAKLGVEPLSDEFSDAALYEILRKSAQPVKKVLMDQYKIVGVGNIYANEALWRSGIDPSRLASRVTAPEATALHDAIVDVLREAIEQRGSSFRDFRDAYGEAGKFVSFLAAYGRAGLPCRRCGNRLVGTHEIDGRQTVLCVRCQH